MITIAVDANGGGITPPAPKIVSYCCWLAHASWAFRVLLFGNKRWIRLELGDHSSGESSDLRLCRPASESHHGTTHPAQAFSGRKKISSVHVVRRGCARSRRTLIGHAGNTGAVMTVARFLLGTNWRASSYGSAAPFPTRSGLELNCWRMCWEQMWIEGSIFSCRLL